MERQNLTGVPFFIQYPVLGKKKMEGCSSERLGWEKRKVLVRDGSSKAAHDTHGRLGTFTARGLGGVAALVCRALCASAAVSGLHSVPCGLLLSCICLASSDRLIKSDINKSLPYFIT